MYFLIDLVELIYTDNRIKRVESSINFYAMDIPMYPVPRSENKATSKILINIAKTISKF